MASPSYADFVSFLNKATATGASRLMPTGGAGSVTFTLTTTGFTGTVQFEGSNDGATTFQKLPYIKSDRSASDIQPVSFTTDTSVTHYVVTTPMLYMRVNVLTASAGNLSAVASASASSPPATLASATGGANKGKFRNLAATVQAVKTAAGTLYGILIVNNQAATAWVQVFDVATGSVTLGTTTPDLEFQVAANASSWVELTAEGVSFANAISIASATAEGGGTGSAAGVHVMPIFD